VKLNACVVPNSTFVAPANPAPVIVTSVPPVSGAAFGLRPEIVGAYENASAEDAAEAPPGETTVTSTVPVPAGLNAVSWVSLAMATFVAGVVPNSTAVALVKPVPMTVTGVPPAAGPKLGLTDETVGAGRYVK
jgi:hypothetical protein